MLEEAEVDAVYRPSGEAMYAPDASTRVHVAGVTETLEGAARPGHFEGVATVVTKLLATVEPDVGGGLAGQTPHEAVDEASTFGRLEGDLERLAPHAGERAVGQLRVPKQVAHPQPVIGDLDIGDQPHQPEGQQDGAVEHRHRDERNDRLLLVELDRDQHHQDDEEAPVEPLAVTPALDRVADREAARRPLRHRDTRTVPVRSIR